MNRAAFLDRDGVINRKAPTEDQYITRWEEMEILPGVPEAIAKLNDVGFRVIVVTNQRGVAKGLITIAELESIHERMCQYLATVGATIDAIYYCPHELDPPCSCRKPEPGMLFQAAHDHNVDLSISWMIGDSVKDVQAGRTAGCKTAQVIEDNKSKESSADVVAPSLFEAADKILKVERGLSETEPLGVVSARSERKSHDFVGRWRTVKQ